MKCCAEIAKDISDLKQQILDDKKTFSLYKTLLEYSKCDSNNVFLVCDNCICWKNGNVDKGFYNDKIAMEKE